MTLAPVRSSGLDSGLQLDISPVAGALGAEVRGLDPDRLDEQAAAALREALNTHLVLFLPGLNPTVKQLRDIGALFGELEVHPYIDKVDNDTPEVCVLDTSATPQGRHLAHRRHLQPASAHRRAAAHGSVLNRDFRRPADRR